MEQCSEPTIKTSIKTSNKSIPVDAASVYSLLRDSIRTSIKTSIKSVLLEAATAYGGVFLQGIAVPNVCSEHPERRFLDVFLGRFVSVWAPFFGVGDCRIKLCEII